MSEGFMGDGDEPQPSDNGLKLVKKAELPTLFFHFIKESLNRYWYPHPHLLARYMAKHKHDECGGWGPVVERFLRERAHMDLLDVREIRALAYHWVDEARVGSAVGDMEVVFMVRKLEEAERKYPAGPRKFYKHFME